MISLKFIPLSFITSNDEIIKQIKNTVVFSHLFETCKETTFSNYIETTQYGFTASALESGSHRLVRITDIHHSKVNWENVPFCDCHEEEKYLLKDNDILVARTGGTTGKSFFVENPVSNAVFASYLIRIRLKKNVNIEFIKAFLNSYCFWSQIVEMKGGSAQPNVNAEKLKILVMPNCDLETQEKTVRLLQDESNLEFEDIRERINFVETLFWNNNQITTELSHQLDLVRQLRQAFLREAMQGKLVPQDTKDEPAEILLEKIKAEKYNRLLACSRDRLTVRPTKDKPLPEIKAEEIPFEIPNNWTWCRLGEFGNLKRGKSKHRPRNDSQLFDNGKYPFIQTGDVSKAKSNNDLITTINGYYNEFGLKQSEMQSKGTLCITIAANIAECGFLDFDACVPDSIVCCSSVNKHAEKFIYYYLKIAKEELERFAPATAQKNINLGILNDLSTPLPPLAEQKRIVEKLEKLMRYCDELEQNIKHSKANAEALLQVALKEALES